MPGVVYVYFLKFIVFIERMCCKYIYLGKIYYRLFYRRMIAREAELADLKSGEKVLHIGGGSFPLTAIHLALEGHKVQVIDKDIQAVNNAKCVVEKWGLQEYIEVVEADGLEVSGEKFDVVWISLHVHPKDEIIENLLCTLPSSGRILYRNPRGMLRRLYPTVDPDNIMTNGAYRLSNQILQKESILIFP